VGRKGKVKERTGKREGNEQKRKRGIFLAIEGKTLGIILFQSGTYRRRESRNNFEKGRKKRPDFRLKPGIREALP
jgi:hypothetical protein